MATAFAGSSTLPSSMHRCSCSRKGRWSRQLMTLKPVSRKVGSRPAQQPLLSLLVQMALITFSTRPFGSTTRKCRCP